MKRFLLLLLMIGCGGAPPVSSEISGRSQTDFAVPSTLTAISAVADPEADALGPLPIRTQVAAGSLHVAVGVGTAKACSFGQSDGPTARDASVDDKGELALDLDEKDTHAWLYGGASIECEGDEPLFAWSLLEPKVQAPKVDVTLDEGADAMLSDEDTYVVRVRGHALEPVREATLVIGGEKYAAKVTELRDEITHWEMTFDVRPETWVASVLRGKDSAELVARLGSENGERLVDAKVTMGLEARVTDASHQPLDTD